MGKASYFATAICALPSSRGRRRISAAALFHHVEIAFELW
jgi:hypothetical protein